MSEHTHPIQKAQLHTFQRRDTVVGGAPFIARFHPYDTWPIFFSGQSEAEVIEKAEDFRADVIEKNEAAYTNRMAGIEKASASREAKKAAT